MDFEIEKVGRRKIKFNGEIISGRILSTRIIFCTEDYVIKVDVSENKYNGFGLQGKREYERWLIIKETNLAEYFVPILFAKELCEPNWVVVQPRIKKYKKLRKGDTTKTLEYVFEVCPFQLRDVSSGVDCNWFLVDGKPIIYDYAF